MIYLLLLIKKQVPHAHAANVKSLKLQIGHVNEVTSAKGHVLNSWVILDTRDPLELTLLELTLSLL